MNIKQAKEYIKNSVNLYLKKNEFGEYRVSVVRQRPVFLLGAPGQAKSYAINAFRSRIDGARRWE